MFLPIKHLYFILDVVLFLKVKLTIAGAFDRHALALKSPHNLTMGHRLIHGQMKLLWWEKRNQKVNLKNCFVYQILMIIAASNLRCDHSRLWHEDNLNSSELSHFHLFLLCQKTHVVWKIEIITAIVSQTSKFLIFLLSTIVKTRFQNVLYHLSLVHISFFTPRWKKWLNLTEIWYKQS